MVQLDRRTLFKVSAAAAALGAAGLPVQAEARPRVARVLATNMVVPWGIAFLPNGDALVSERESGRISRVSRHGGRRTVGRIAKIDASAGEGGLLGLAVHPRFAENRWVYAYYTSAADNRVVRMRFRSGSLGRRHAVLTGIPRGDGRHNGGRLAFGPDGMLYITTGDTGNGALAQDKTSLAGKILRVTPRGGVPADNPYGNPVWTLGHRNVEGITFDHQGVAWATEFGESTTDELNKIVKGANYGWPVVEGGDGPGGFHNPFVQWSPTSICSPSGVAIRNGRAWVGALHGACLYSVVLRGPHKKKKVRWFHDRFGRIRTVQRAPDGSLWITTSNRDGRGSPSADDDRVIRITLG
jgi:glucose/arabinose dehydrogenase